MTTSIYEFDDFREFLKTWLKSPERSQRGLQGTLAKAIGISSSLMTLILQGEKAMSPEQASEATAFIGLREKESEFFILLVQYASAGTPRWQARIKKNLDKIREEVRKVSGRVESDLQLSEAALAEYYASWMYSAIRGLTAIPGLQNLNTIASHLGLPAEVVSPVIDYLIKNHLCVETPDGISYGPAHLHTSAESPLAYRHHQNWRNRAQVAMDLRKKKDLFYTCTMILSEQDAEAIRNKLLLVVEKILERARPSKSETGRCLNLDFFKF